MNVSYDRSQPTLWACDEIEAEVVNPPEPAAERSDEPARTDGTLHPARAEEPWEEVFSRQNLYRALQRVERNGGAAGMDGMKVSELSSHLKANWPAIHHQLDSGTYRPQPVRRVSIPKLGGSKRELGVPTVTDRLTFSRRYSRFRALSSTRASPRIASGSARGAAPTWPSNRPGATSRREVAGW